MTQSSLTLEPASTPEEIEAGLAVREDMYSDYLGLSPRTWPDEDVRDHEGYLLVLRDDGKVVGSGRILPITSAHVELRAFRKLPAWAERDRLMCEISRIAARPREQGVPYSWIGFIFGAEWLLRHTELRRYIAYARADLVQLYGVVGAREIGVRFQIPARGSAVYSVLTGSLEETVTKGVGLLAEAATKAEVAKIAAGEDTGSV